MEDFHMWATFAIIAVAIVAYVTEKTPIEITGVGVVVAFLLLFQLFPYPNPDGSGLFGAEELLAGFANPALFTILALLVIGQGLFQTGALDGLAQRIGHWGGGRNNATLAAVLIVTGILSAFMNNTPVVVLMLPVLGAVAMRARQSPSKVMIPLSFVSILGGMTTLIGSSTNLLVAGQASDMGQPAITFFDFTGIGVILAVIGGIYAVFVLPRLLPARATMLQEVGGGQGKQFIAQIPIGYDNPLVGSKAVAGMFPALKGMTVVMVQRGDHPYLPPFEDVELQAGDIIVVAATRSVLTDALKGTKALFSADPVGSIDEGEDDAAPPADGPIMLAEAVVAPGSRLIGRTIEMSALRSMTGCIVLGIQRQSRMIRMRMSDIRLEAGDVLLVSGSRSQVEGLRLSRDVILLEWSAAEVPLTERAGRALAIFLAVVAVSASGLLPIATAAITGALALVPAGCLNIRQAARAFDRRIYVLIGSSLAMAAPLEVTGGARFIAEEVVALLNGQSPAVIMSALFLLIAIMTNFLSNNATAVLFTPIAISTAMQIGVDPFPFIVTVILAANCSFATPIGYQTNLLVMTPGHYRFADFVKVGTPLVLLIWLAYSIIGPWYYGF
ncbi:SLC13 family permease [Microbaculum marinum]|uniref:SLC13 family permease n=1 Tax=Microbaculum marinum TaxID=1764581 RepID=A0AAW9RXN7_9HYPH